MGPELLGDAEWITLFSEGTAPLVENPGITMKVWTQDLYNKVVLEAFDQLGRERPADANGDIGAYELFSQKGNLNRDTVVDLEDAIIGLQVITGREITVLYEPWMDVNIDGKIGLEEVLYILQEEAVMR